MKSNPSLKKLCDVYKNTSQIGLVIGAGVSKISGVPLYKELALYLFEETEQKLLKNGAPEEAIEYLRGQLQLLKANKKLTIEPDKVIQFIAMYLDSEQAFKQAMKKIIFRDVPRDAAGNLELTHKRISSETFRKNPTLDAVITFCAAIPAVKTEAAHRPGWLTNPKVGAILTTNYDNLVEGSFGTKYGKSLLKPVARLTSKEAIPGKDIIPVYHMHGYISYITDKRSKDGVKASNLVAAENDYYDTFYNYLGYQNRIASSFLRRYPAIFIGCSMQDINIRRILFQLQREKIASSDLKLHFALIPAESSEEDTFGDTLLNALGVDVIRLPGDNIGEQIRTVLRQVYTSEKGIDEET